ncbi:MAG: hypothetical protein ACLVC2_10995, partial [Emergencia timonensis]|uniref:hypothetical protein n=1 Tax=Emergencia timonensis TaxID=1776384 RepID=UPI001D082742
IMIPQSYGVAARQESLNHVLRFYFQRNAHDIIILMKGTDYVVVFSYRWLRILFSTETRCQL